MSSHEACCGTMFWVYLMSCAGLVMFAGLMSGLTLGLMSLSIVDLEVLSKAGTPQDRRNAARIMPVVKNQHLLLCTLLIGNSLAMEALPIFLDSLVPSFGAILISVTLILAFDHAAGHLHALRAQHGGQGRAHSPGTPRPLLPRRLPHQQVVGLAIGKRPCCTYEES
ncbi:hypothetical protein ACQ4PT_023883 [Festuca glaucescens]